MQVERFGVIGEMTLIQKDGTPIPVTITLEPGNYRASGRIYRVIDASNQELGMMTTFINGYSDKPNSDWVEIEELHNHTKKLGKQKVKDIGKILVRYAVMRSLYLKYEGRVQTTSSGDSHYFYWSIGMRPVENRVFASPEARKIYNKMIKKKTLSDFEATQILPVLKLYAMKETGKSEAELTPDEICFIDLSKRMQKQFDRALANNEYAHYGQGSLRMHLPKENLHLLGKSCRNSFYSAHKVLMQTKAIGL